MNTKEIKDRQYSASMNLWIAILTIDAILLTAKTIFDNKSDIETTLFVLFILVSAFLIIINFYYFRKVQNDKLEYKTNHNPKQHYNYHAAIKKFSVKTEITSLIFIFLAIAIWVQKWL